MRVQHVAIETTTHGCVEALAEVPDELRVREQWVCWRYKKRAGAKATKVPFNVRTNQHAKTDDPSTWATFAEAVNGLASGRYDGVGYVFSEDCPYAGVDFDACRSAETGAVEGWVLGWVEAFGGYTEASPSGTGLHAIVRGDTPGRKNDKAGVEAYSSRRFFSVTGQTITELTGEIPERQAVLDKLAGEYFAPAAPEHEVVEKPTAVEPVTLEDGELLDKARTARQGERFSALFDRGDFLDNPSHSEARMELLRRLAFWTAWDAERMARLYERSALYAMPGYATKWARLGDREIRRAIAAQPKGYRQQARPSKADGGELARIVAALQGQAANMAWEGRGGPTDSHVYGALLNVAARYGTPAKKGILVSADVRTLALEAGVGLSTVSRSLKRLHDPRKLLRLSKKSTSKRAAVYLLKYPADETAQGGTQPQCVVLCSTLSAPTSQLRNRAPGSEKEYDNKGRKRSIGKRHLLERLGKMPALVLERCAAAGDEGVSLAELAHRLDRRARNLRRAVEKLQSAGLLFEVDGRLRVPDNLDHRLDVELAESGCKDARKRDAERYARERTAFYDRDANPASHGEDVYNEEAASKAHRERVEAVLRAFVHDNSGPQRILHTYLDGDTQKLEYVVRAVVYYRGIAPEGDAWRLWWCAVEDAVALYAGEVVEGTED